MHTDHSMFLRTEASVILLKSLPEGHSCQFLVPSYSWHTSTIYLKTSKIIPKQQFLQMTHPLLNLEKAIVTCKVTEINFVTGWITTNCLLTPQNVKLCVSAAPTKICWQFITNPFLKKNSMYLAVLIDSKLTFRDHISHVVKKLEKFCGLIYRVCRRHCRLKTPKNARVCKRLLLTPYSWKKSKSKSVDHTLMKVVAPNEFGTCWYRNYVSGTNRNLPKNITRLYIADSSDLITLFCHWKGRSLFMNYCWIFTLAYQ